MPSNPGRKPKPSKKFEAHVGELVDDLLRYGFKPEQLRDKSIAELEDLKVRALRDFMRAPGPDKAA